MHRRVGTLTGNMKPDSTTSVTSQQAYFGPPTRCNLMSEASTSPPTGSGTQDPAMDENIADHLNPQIPQCGQPMDNPFPKYEGDAWKDVLDHCAEPDRARCKAWREEVETLLIFAGLFSAVVTAFIIESYKSLREDFGDTSTALLRRIALQLEGNGTVPSPPASVFEPSSSSIRVNTLWFLSLILSLTTVLIGTLCLQWLREHLRLPSNPKEALPLHNMQEESLDRWYVPQIFTTLPILLQFAVIIFFVGIIDFLWQLHHTVAAFSLAFIGAAIIFYVVTTITPTIQNCLLAFPRLSTSKIPRSPCPYRSPQSFLLLQVVAPLVVSFIHRCIPMGWIWRLYWSYHNDDRGCDRHWQESYHSAPVASRAKSWISLHTSWLLQRDLDFIFSQGLHQINAEGRTIAATEPPHIYFYDNIEALCKLVDTSATAESIAPWVCIENYIQDVASSRMWCKSSLKIFLDAIQGRRDSVRNKKDMTLSSCKSQEFLADWTFCTIGHKLPPKLLRPYWFEKNLRVLGSGVSEVISYRETTNYVARQAITWFGDFAHDSPEKQWSNGQNIINAILTAPMIATWKLDEKIEAAGVLCPLFMKVGLFVGEHYSSSPSIQSRHKATVQIATRSIRASEASETAFLVAMTSYYLFSFFDNLFLYGQNQFQSALKEATVLLSLIRSYRDQHLGAALNDSTERSTLLAIQTAAIPALPGSYWVHWDGLSCKSYFMGIFDTIDGVPDYWLSKHFGSFSNPGIHHSPHPQQIGDTESELRPSIIDIVDNVTSPSGQLHNETAPDTLALPQDVGVDEAVV